MRLDGARADAKLRPDLIVGRPVHHQLHDLALPIGQRDALAGPHAMWRETAILGGSAAAAAALFVFKVLRRRPE